MNIQQESWIYLYMIHIISKQIIRSPTHGPKVPDRSGHVVTSAPGAPIWPLEVQMLWIHEIWAADKPLVDIGLYCHTWLIDWLIDWLMDWLIDWLTDWVLVQSIMRIPIISSCFFGCFRRRDEIQRLQWLCSNEKKTAVDVGRPAVMWGDDAASPDCTSAMRGEFGTIFLGRMLQLTEFRERHSGNLVKFWTWIHCQSEFAG